MYYRTATLLPLVELSFGYNLAGRNRLATFWHFGRRGTGRNFLIVCLGRISISAFGRA